jgi:predicted Zn-dependent protease
MTEPRHGRRALLAAAALLGATAPARAQNPTLNSLFNIGGDLIRTQQQQQQQLTEADEIAIGRDLYLPLVGESGGAYSNRAVQAAVRRFAQPLFQTSARTAFQWEITVVADDSVNAWALPAGKLALNHGLLRYVASEHELAAVIAHEMGHAELSHHLQAMRREAFTRALTAAGRDVLAASMGGPGAALTAAGIDALRGPLHGMIRTGYGREAEREADRHIFTVFKRTGHDPAGAIAFFRTMLEIVPAGSEGTTSLFSTHPGTQARIVDLERDSVEASRVAAGSRTTAAAFAEIKETFPTRRNFRRSTG